MMKIQERMRAFSLLVGFVWSMLVLPLPTLAEGDLGFHEVASTVMINSLEQKEKTSFLRRFYTQLFFVPIWISEDDLSSLGQELFAQIKSDETLPKSSKIYQDAVALQAKAKKLYSQNGTIYDKVGLEFKISQLYKGYADYTLYGSINWGAFQARLYNLKAQMVNAGWVTHTPYYTPFSLIENAVMSGSLKALFDKATPKEYGYLKLRKELVKYIKMQENGGWENLPLRGNLAVGQSSPVVPALRERLTMMGDAKGCQSDTSRYDTCLKEAIKHYQKRHGFIPNGRITQETISALNIPIERRIEQMRLNLDRIKWLNTRNSQHHIMINIPAFTLFFEEDKKLIQEMKVITGKKSNPTPIFSNTVKTIVLNPQWNVPTSIIQNEMIPKLLRNPNAMARQGIEIFAGWDEDAKKISGGSVDWGQYRYSANVPYRFAQVSGSRNALGKIKFLFPNQFSVYMHDTPNKKLFNNNIRAYSHGCIRLAQPKELLKTFSTFNNINLKSSTEILKGSKKSYLGLNNKVPIDVVYLTAYVDYDGVLQFRNDIYGYDKMQLQSYRKW